MLLFVLPMASERACKPRAMQSVWRWQHDQYGFGPHFVTKPAPSVSMLVDGQNLMLVVLGSLQHVAEPSLATCIFATSHDVCLESAVHDAIDLLTFCRCMHGTYVGHLKMAMFCRWLQSFPG